MQLVNSKFVAKTSIFISTCFKYLKTYNECF
jgi:hypothetical protein